MCKNGTYKVIALSGSTKFKDEYLQAQNMLSLEGNIVLMCPIFHHADGVSCSPAKFAELRKVHKQRIDMADELYVINKDGYVGTGTREEIEYALAQGKIVRYMFSCEQ